MNGDLESPATQLSFLPPVSQFDDEVYEDDFDSIMAGVLDPDAGFRTALSVILLITMKSEILPSIC